MAEELWTTPSYVQVQIVCYTVMRITSPVASDFWSTTATHTHSTVSWYWKGVWESGQILVQDDRVQKWDSTHGRWDAAGGGNATERGIPTRIKLKKWKPLTILREIWVMLILPADVDEGSRLFYLNLKGQVAPIWRTLQTFSSQQWHYTCLCDNAKVVRNYAIGSNTKSCIRQWKIPSCFLLTLCLVNLTILVQATESENCQYKAFIMLWILHTLTEPWDYHSLMQLGKPTVCRTFLDSKGI